MAENIDILLRDLGMIDSGWHRHENPATGAVALFPNVVVHPTGSAEQRKLEDAWEHRSREMHAAQKTIMPAAKPLGNVLSDKLKLIRGN